MAQTVLMFTEQLDSFVIDVTLEETHTNTLNITDYPVEKGANISDHAQIQPKTFDLIGANSAMQSGFYDPSVMAASYTALLAVQEKRQPFSVSTALVTLKNMLIESFTVTQDTKTANILKFVAHLKEVIFTETETTFTSGGKSISSGKPDAEGNADPITDNKITPVKEIDAVPDVSTYLLKTLIWHPSHSTLTSTTITDSLNLIEKPLVAITGEPLTVSEMNRILGTNPKGVPQIVTDGGG